jgi:hypothetical protein
MSLALAVGGFLVGVAALLGYLGFVLFTNGARRRGVLSGLVAVVLGAVTYTTFWPALTLLAAGDETVRLRADLANATRQNETLQTDARSSKTLAERQASEIALLTRSQSERLITLQAEIDRVVGAVADPRSGLAVETPTRAALSSASHGSATHFDRVTSSIRDLATIRPKDAVPATRTTDQTRDLMQLRDRMGARLSTPSYDVEVYPDKELVGGRVGKYYVVDLKDAASGIRYYFDGGRYTLARGNAEFRSSLNAFIGDVLGKMQGNVRFDLFVRGSADRKPYEGRFEQGQEITNVRYFRSLGGDKYGREQAELKISDGIVRNKDLPNLRAAFLKGLITEIYPVKPPEVLEGNVTAADRTKDRNAELILFVEW